MVGKHSEALLQNRTENVSSGGSTPLDTSFDAALDTAFDTAFDAAFDTLFNAFLIDLFQKFVIVNVDRHWHAIHLFRNEGL